MSLPPAYILRADAGRLPLADGSVDLIVTSPPYFALRSYRDEGEHFDGQIGSEAHPQEWLENLWAVLKECWRVLKPEGSCWVNLGDKRAMAGGTPRKPSPAQSNGWGTGGKAVNNARVAKTWGFRPKSKMLLPHRFAIGCEDGLADPEGIGWIVRQDVVWAKRNSLPESVVDRCRDSHEFIFHLTKSERYYSAMDEIREPQVEPGRSGTWNGTNTGRRRAPPEVEGNNWQGWQGGVLAWNPLGKLPGSVWPMASEPLLIPEWAKEKYRLPDHFAAFPTELPRRIILGWSPPGICVACGEERRPVVEKEFVETPTPRGPDYRDAAVAQIRGEPTPGNARLLGRQQATILGYACACTPYTDHPGERVGVAARTGSALAVDPGNAPRQSRASLGDQPRNGPWREYHLSGWTPPPTRPSVILDCFGGTGTTAMVARALGRIGISVDLSADYGRLAKWRVFESGAGKKAEQRTWAERQGNLL